MVRAFALLAMLWFASTANAQEDGAAPQPDETALIVRAFAGAGLGTRDFSWQSPAELRSVETGPFAALELGGSFLLAFSEMFSLGPMSVAAGGAGHEGADSLGRNVYQSALDPGYAALERWVLASSSAVSRTPNVPLPLPE